MMKKYFSNLSGMYKSNRYGCWLTVVLLLKLGWKVILLSWDAFPFNSDEAIVALMAKHILAGERPIFFYGQAYMGSLDAYLVAIGFAVFGEKVWVIRLLQSSLYAVTIVITYFIGKKAFHSPRIGLIAAILLAFPTVNGTLYTTISLGGYGEALLIGSLSILLVFMFEADLQNEKISLHWIFFLGFVFGLGVWVHGITLVFTIPVLLYLLYLIIDRKIIRQTTLQLVLFALAGAFLGILPIIFFVFQNGAQAVMGELFGSAVSVEQGTWLGNAFNHLLYLLVFGVPVMFGMRPPWTTTLQQIWLIPGLVIFLVLIGFIVYRDIRTRKFPRPAFLLLAIILFLFAAFIGTSFGVDPSGRYFMPLLIPGALLAGYGASWWIERHTLFGILIGLVCFYQIMVTGSLAMQFPYLTTQFYTPAMLDHRFDDGLIEFLQTEQLSYGYSTYWVSYPLAFLSDEQLIYVPALPYHPDLGYTPRDNRYEPYQKMVDQSPVANYIVANNSNLDALLQNKLSQAGIVYDYHEIGPYHIYYHLSETILPEQIHDKFLSQ